MRVSELWMYPVKSCRGVRVRSARATRAGFVDDRRFMVVNEEGVFLSQRRYPALATVVAQLHDDILELAARGSTVRVSRQPSGERREVEVWGERVEAVDCGGLVASWLTELLGVSAHLAWMPDGEARPTDEAFTAGEVGFADGFPYLLTTEGSLESLNRELAKPVTMDRFRPNIVVAGAAAWEELGWSGLSVGGATLEAVKPCERCTMVTIDQDSGSRTGIEPMKTLAREHDNVFGVNAVCLAEGVIRVGDPVGPT
ncbi:MAG: MOSC domain-containing protein [Deltaproteobacteria bacterium]|nr:MAG: MOSC domain-containing protein [Deltaproteobacteria bacterium]